MIIPDGGCTCIATGLSYRNFFDANSASRVEDRCPTTKLCARDAATGDRRHQMQNGGKSIEFHVSYCIGGRKTFPRHDRLRRHRRLRSAVPCRAGKGGGSGRRPGQCIDEHRCRDGLRGNPHFGKKFQGRFTHMQPSREEENFTKGLISVIFVL